MGMGVFTVFTCLSETRWKTWYFVKEHTATMPGWVRRRCRRELLPLVRRWILHGRAEDRENIKATFQRLRKTNWEALPPDLPRDMLEDADEWLARMYAAGGWKVSTW